MRKRLKTVILLLAFVIIICFAGVSTYSEPDQHAGKHLGELKFLEIKVVYTNPYFFTSEGRAGYYIGLPMTYELHLTNTGKRTYKRLTVTAIQEYYESGVCDRWWYPYPREAEYQKGEPLPGDSAETWKKVEIGPEETLILKDSYTAPYETCAGLDQTHVIIKHTNEGNEESARIYYNPEAGVYCPPPPGTETSSGSTGTSSTKEASSAMEAALSGSSGHGQSKTWAKCGCLGWEAIVLFIIIALIKRRRTRLIQTPTQKYSA